MYLAKEGAAVVAADLNSRGGEAVIMFNNAGLVGAVGLFEAISADDWDRTIAVLLRSVFLGIKYAVEPMRRAGGGSIISTSSVASFLPSAVARHMRRPRAR